MEILDNHVILSGRKLGTGMTILTCGLTSRVDLEPFVSCFGLPHKTMSD